MKKLVFLAFFILFMLDVAGQQSAQFTQYMYNMSVVNPAYATTTLSELNLGTLYRSQWAGVEGSPKTVTLFAHTPINEKLETGFSLVSDDIGDGAKKETNFFADIAYVLQLDEIHRFSFGVKAGLSSMTTNFNGFKLNSGDSATDKAFAENVNEVLPNLGFGGYFFTDNYYVGLSVPNFLSSENRKKKSEINSLGLQEIHTYLTAGYVFDINREFKLKPAAMAIMVKGAPVSMNITANVLYNDKFEAGLSYRIDDAVSLLMSVNVMPNFRVGYSYDYTLSNLSQFSSGSHEIVLLYNLNILGKGHDVSPRFF